MNVSELIHDASAVKAALVKLPDSSVITTKALAIQIPTKFAEKGLAEIRDEIQICGIAAWIVEGKYYSVSLTNAMMRIAPLDTRRITIDEVEYYEFIFEPGQVVLPTAKLPKVDTLVYSIFEELYTKGRVPWYVKYSEYGQLFDSAKKHANANLGDNSEKMEILASLVARDKTDRMISYRTKIDSYGYMQRHPPVFIGLRSIQYAATNTTAKIAGSYFRAGTISALNTKTLRVEPVERLLRK